MSLWLDMLGATVRTLHTRNFGPVRVAEAGVGNPETVVFLHGIGGHLEAYAKNVVALGERFHTVAYDFLGHGLSAKPVLNYSPPLLVDHLNEVLDALGKRSAHLCGESLGGWVSGLFAAAHPERVQRLILNTAAGLPILGDKGRADLAALIDLSRKAATQGPPTHASILARMQWLFLWTEDNPVHDVETARQSAAQVPGSQLYVMRAPSAHWPQYEAPEEFNGVVERFLADGVV